jgi:FkbM family methyltransferase
MTTGERARFFRSAGAYADLLEARHGELRFLVSTRDTHVAQRLFERGARGEMSTLRRALEVLAAAGTPVPEGSTFVDVGANIGTTTLPAICLHEFGRAVACEPARDNAALLRCNTVLNGVDDRVRVLPIAVSDRDEAVYLHVNSSNSGGHRVVADGRRRGSELKVEACSLDTLVRRGLLVPEDVGLLWLDVQGHEAKVLAGATRLTALGVPVVLELHPTMLGAEGVATIEAIAARDYTHVHDLRRRDEEWRPADGLHELRAQLVGQQRINTFSDVLLARRES